MSNNPLNRKSLSRAGVIGGVLAVVGIILFVVLWLALGQTDMDAIARLLIAFCLPPALLALGAGAYMLVVKPKNTK